MIIGLVVLGFLFQWALTASTSVAPWDFEEIKRQGVAPLSFGDVRIISKQSTHKGKAIAISNKLAFLFGLILEESPVEKREFQFQEQTVKLHLRPVVLPGTAAYIVEINVHTISVLGTLEKDQIIISSKVELLPIRGANMNDVRWRCLLEVKDLRKIVSPTDTFQIILQAASDYDPNSLTGRYLYARRHIKKIFQDYDYGLISLSMISNEFYSSKVDRMIKQLSKRQLEDIWEDSLKYNKRYAMGHLIIKWFVYLCIGKTLKRTAVTSFSTQDLALIADNVITRKSLWELKDLLNEKGLLKISDDAVRAYLRRIRQADYLNSMNLACITLDKFMLFK